MKVSYNWLQDYFDKELPAPEKLGEKITMQAFELESIEKVGSDYVLDLDVKPNRAHDALSHRGIAKEISVLFDIPLKKDPLKETPDLSPDSNILDVHIEDKNLCRRYSAAVVRGVEIKETPQYIKDYLEALGQKSINNIVDITNYVMFNIGQPLHAFDAAKLSTENGGKKIVIRQARAGEKIKTLDNEDYSLSNKDLVIADGFGQELPIGIAGIKGGDKAKIDDSTKDIVLESANFHPTSVRKTSQSLKLRTDASARFENEPSKELTALGINEAASLIVEHAGGEVEGYSDIYPQKKNPYLVGVSVGEINNLLGSDIKEHEVEDILERFSFEYKRVENPINEALEGARLLAGVPYKYGASISYEAPGYFDCSSFVSYVFLRVGIQVPRMAIDQYFFGKAVEEKDLIAGDIIFSVGSSGEVRKESVDFIPGLKEEKGVSHCGIYLGDGKVIHASGKESRGEVVIENITESPDFKEIIGYRRLYEENKARYVVTVPYERLDLERKEDLIEEIGRVYGYEKIDHILPEKISASVNKKFYYSEKIRDILTRNGFYEVYTYAFQNDGEVELENPLAEDKKFLRRSLSEGIGESLDLNVKNAPLLGMDMIKIFEIGKVFTKEGEHSSLCIGITPAKKIKKSEEAVEVLFVEGKKALEEAFSVSIEEDQKRGILELNLDSIIDTLSNPGEYDVSTTSEEVVYKKISQYPFVLRDIALWVPEGVSSEQVLEKITEESGALLVSSSLFDEYKKDGRTSYAFSLVFQSQEKTLTDEEINGIMGRVTDVLHKNDGWEVR